MFNKYEVFCTKYNMLIYTQVYNSYIWVLKLMSLCFIMASNVINDIWYNGCDIYVY